MDYNIYNINGSKVTKNNEKSILVAYIDTYGLSRKSEMLLVNSFKNEIEKSFNSIETDDTMVFIYLPSDHNDIKILNPTNSFLTEEDINKYKEALNNFIENNK